MNYVFLVGGWTLALILGMLIVPKILLISYKERLRSKIDKSLGSEKEPSMALQNKRTYTSGLGRSVFVTASISNKC